MASIQHAILFQGIISHSSSRTLRDDDAGWSIGLSVQTAMSQQHSWSSKDETL